MSVQNLKTQHFKNTYKTLEFIQIKACFKNFKIESKSRYCFSKVIIEQKIICTKVKIHSAN